MKSGALSLFVVAGLSTSAYAHIHLTNPLSRTDNVQGDPQKTEHCGDPTYDRAANPSRVTMYPPGATVTVTWAETINHPGHFRIAFQQDGAIFPIPPAGNAPPGNFPSLDQTGMDGGVAGVTILKDMIDDGLLSTTITLPTTECTNCTLQFIQVMTDKPPYTIDANSDDIYFNCADIVIQAGAPMPPDPVPMDDAGPGAGGDGGAIGGPSEVTGGCSTSGSSTTALFGLALLVGLRRRRR
ncbi:MAG: SCE4755 family polysaccharide monooxygenase-like protein [Kofleriaceae bacterium]